MGRRECRPIRDSRLDGVRAKGNGEFLERRLWDEFSMRLPSSGYFQVKSVSQSISLYVYQSVYQSQITVIIMLIIGKNRRL